MSGFITGDGADYLMSVVTGIEEPITQFWVALVTSPVGASEAGSELAEPIATDYARAYIANGPENWTVAYGAATNITIVTFVVPGVDPWTGIVGWAICDAETEGRVLYAGEMEPFDVAVGDQTQLPPGSITLSVELDGWRQVT